MANRRPSNLLPCKCGGHSVLFFTGRQWVIYCSTGRGTPKKICRQRLETNMEHKDKNSAVLMWNTSQRKAKHMHEVTITITVQTDIDASKSYPNHMTEAGKAVQTVKDKITSVFGPSATFENSYVTDNFVKKDDTRL